MKKRENNVAYEHKQIIAIELLQKQKFVKKDIKVEREVGKI